MNMRQAETTSRGGADYCLRHPATETNLRCGRCEDLICPQCMVTSPVGARCPKCARIGRPAVLDTSVTEMSRAIIFGVVAAILTAAILTGIFWVIAVLPAGLVIVDVIAVIGGLVGAGYVIGEAVRIGSGNKLDQRLKYVAMGCAFLMWVVGMFLLWGLGGPVGILANTFGIVGMVISVYTASMRVRIP